MNALHQQIADVNTPFNSVKLVTGESVAVLLADEGIPVRAIARSLKIPSGEVYEALREAKMEGKLIDLPPDDWPPGQSRAARLVGTGSPLHNEDTMRIACAQQFKTSRLETYMLMQLLRREHATKQQLHRVVEDNRPSPGTKDETDIKMVDVIICKLRKKLLSHNITVETVWGLGYLLKPDQRARCLEILGRN